MDTVILRYDEIALKSPHVRRRFEDILKNNVVKMLQGKKIQITKKGGRFFIKTDGPAKVAKLLSNLPGVSSTSPAKVVRAEMEEIITAATELAKKIISPKESFAVRTTRHGEHPFSSADVNRAVGKKILSAIDGIKVDLDNPDREIFIEIREDQAYVFTEYIRGLGGLPVGSQGKVVAIFGNEKRKIKAALLMLKRGCEVALLSFDHRRAKVVAAAKKLLKHHHAIEIFLMPKPLLKVDPSLKPYIEKAFMRQIASILAEEIGAVAIVSADAIEDISKIGLRGLKLLDSVA
ncbi:MAG: THUMP domain-containing protein, partial [Candidatus Hadarchaeales archaeon]